MKLEAVLFLLLVVCSSCSRSFPVRASLDRSAWFASLSNGTPKIYEGDRLSLIFATDLPHPELEKKKSGKVTGCKIQCNRTQTLLLSNIPLRPGLYRITQSGLDSLQDTSVYCSYATEGVAKIITRTYNQGNGWLQVTQYDSTTSQLMGKFDIRFKANDGSSRAIHFRRGKLNLLVNRKPLS